MAQMAKTDMGQMIVKPAVENLAEAARAAAATGKPPVNDWDPPHCGPINIRIGRDGTWYHEGRPITRPGLVRLFASILRRDGEEYVLVTPVEKFSISVEDAPFVAQDFEVSGSGRAQEITFFTNVADAATAGPDHPFTVHVDPDTGAPAPYVTIRPGLKALIDRKSFYRLVDLGTEDEVEGKPWFGLWSSGRFFPMIPASDLAV